MNELPHLKLIDRLAVIRDVVLPTVVKGPIARRPSMMRLAERFAWDERSVRRLRKVREQYGDGPVILRVLLKKQALILSHDHALRVLEQTPEPFSPASYEKVAALGHFEPGNSLVSRGEERECRRALSEDVLQPECPRHGLAARFGAAAAEEMERLVRSARSSGADLDWDGFSPAWDRVVRRVVLGDGASDDTALSDDLLALRKAGNWAFAHPLRRRTFDRFRSSLKAHLARREPGSLASRLTEPLDDRQTAPLDQYAHYLFAFDATGLALMRALAVLSVRRGLMAPAAAEIADTGGNGQRPYLRGCVLEALRLWPTTIVILRESTSETSWPNGHLPAGYGVWILSSYFHRDESRLDGAHEFRPDLWRSETPVPGLAIVPFSAGPGMCPGRHVVQHTAAAALAAVLREANLTLREPERVGASGDLPMTLDHTTLRFGVSQPSIAVEHRRRPSAVVAT